MTAATITPEQIRVTPDRRTLVVVLPGGERIELPAEMLRVMSPSAEVQGHSPAQRQTVGGKIDVEIIDIQPVGNYAIRIMFDDLHNSGIFTWTYLAELGREKTERWEAYLTELKAKGLKRER